MVVVFGFAAENFHHQDWPSLRDNDRHHVVEAPPHTSEKPETHYSSFTLCRKSHILVQKLNFDEIWQIIQFEFLRQNSILFLNFRF